MLSPDKKLEAFVYKYNVYVRPRGGGDSTQLTTDGVQYWSYGLTDPRPSELQRPQPRRPQMRWSPDSKKLIVSRNDERHVGADAVHLVHAAAAEGRIPAVRASRRYDRPGAGLPHHRRRERRRNLAVKLTADAEPAHDHRLGARFGVEHDVGQSVRHVAHARFQERVSRVGGREDGRRIT